jgi:hypothetical protein
MVDPQTRVVRLTLVRITRIAVIASMALALGAMAAHAQPRSASSAAPAAALRTHAHARTHHHHRTASSRATSALRATPARTRVPAPASPAPRSRAPRHAIKRSRTGGTRGGARYALAPTPTSALMPTSVRQLEPRWNESAMNHWSIVLAGRGPPRASPSSRSAEPPSPAARNLARTTASAASRVASTCRPAPPPNHRHRSATAFAPRTRDGASLAFTPLTLQPPGSIPGISAIRSPEGEPERLFMPS